MVKINEKNRQTPPFYAMDILILWPFRPIDVVSSDILTLMVSVNIAGYIIFNGRTAFKIDQKHKIC
jgi:hypothetical protein